MSASDLRVGLGRASAGESEACQRRDRHGADADHRGMVDAGDGRSRLRRPGSSPAPSARPGGRVADQPDDRPRTGLRPSRGHRGPQVTAYLSSTRRPGAVFRVSRSRTSRPPIAATKADVRVAIPDIRWAKFSATRSPVMIERAGPLIDASGCPGTTASPSATAGGTATVVSTSSYTLCTTDSPATRPAVWRSSSPRRAARPGRSTAWSRRPPRDPRPVRPGPRPGSLLSLVA